MGSRIRAIEVVDDKVERTMKTLIGALLVVSMAMTADAGEWKLVWSDEFDKAGLPDAARWGYETGFIRNHEKQFYTKARKENARVEDGMLIIEARKEKYKDPGRDPAAKGGGKGRAKRSPEEANYTSASLTTRGKAAWTHGRIEVRAKLPSGRGTWPAFWTLGTNIDQVGWPACGEIDIMEHVGFDPGVVHANIHTRKYNHVANTGKGDKISLIDVSRAFHVYAIEWDEKKIDFFSTIASISPTATRRPARTRGPTTKTNTSSSTSPSVEIGGGRRASTTRSSRSVPTSIMSGSIKNRGRLREPDGVLKVEG